MVPSRLARAFSRLHATVIRLRVMEVLAPLRPYSDQKRPEIHALLETFAGFTAGYSQFGEPERALLRALKLTALVDATWWAKLVTAASRSNVPDDVASELTGIVARLQFVSDGFPAIAGMLEESRADADADSNGLVLMLGGTDQDPVSLERVAGAIQGVHELWTVAQDLTGEPGALQLLATDPGLTTALYFDGAADPLVELRALLISVWSNAARLPGVPAEQQAALIPDMLPVMERIGRGDGATRIRGMIESGARRLLEANCKLRGMELAASAAPEASVPTTPVRGNPVPTPDLASDDMTHLAEVIAEERRQLQPAGSARRLWHGATSAQQ